MSETTQAGTTMQPATPAAVQAASPSFSQADLDRVRAEGVEQGTQAERARVGAVLAHPSASCSPLALQCINTGLTTEQATAVLGAVPATATSASAPANAFAAAMAAVPNPGVSGIEVAAAHENTEAALAASIVGLIGVTR